jgi:HNH endonuclease
MAIDVALRRLIRQRAENRCEYCGLHQDDLPLVILHVDHVISRQHLGGDGADNLCVACHWCNFNKGPNIATRESGDLVPLFNPRTQVWADHFSISEDRIVGLTPIGRGTVRLLDMNDDDRRQIRAVTPRNIP